MVFFFFAPQIRTHIAHIQTLVSVSGETNLYSGESLLQNIICRLLIDCIQQYKINSCTVKMELCQNNYMILPQRSLCIIHPDTDMRVRIWEIGHFLQN